MAKSQAEKMRQTVPDMEALSQLFKAAGDPLRLDIIRALKSDSFGVQELASIFAMPQPGMSHHLKILAAAGILATRREGNSIFYRRHMGATLPRFVPVLEALFAATDSCALADEYVLNIQKIYEERALQSQQFFQKNAREFKEHQAHLCELKQYQAELEHCLQMFPDAANKKVLEVGSGHGELLKVLTSRFAHVVALDASDEMLSVAKAKTHADVEFRHGTLERMSADKSHFDGVVLNMVLHHMPSPAGFFKDVSRHLQTGGMLVIADLCSHQQEWVKGSCGDVWLGFASEDLDRWAENSGFESRQSQFIGLKNGFQIQIKLFQKV